MEHADLMVDDVAPAHDGLPDPVLLAEARIKAEKLREFVEETADELGDSHEPASPGMIRAYNSLRALVVEALPRLAATLPPAIPIPQIGPNSGAGDGAITYRELIFYCDQIKDSLGRWVEGGHAPRVDDGSTLFGPDGLRHDPALVAAARVKAQSLLDFVEKRAEEDWLESIRVPVAVLEDYHQLLALIREAAPELATVLPREIPIPTDPKPRSEDQPAPSVGSWLFSSLTRGARPKTPKYRELLYFCQQIARLLK